MNLNTLLPTSTHRFTFADFTPAEDIELCRELDLRTKQFFDEEDAWDRTFQYGADVGLDTGPTS